MKARTLVSLFGLVSTCALLVGQVSRLWTDPSFWPPLDFVEYWGAGRLCLQGDNPYSEDLLLKTERLAGHDQVEAVMMWNPPWTLTLVMPLGLLPGRSAQFVWLVVNLAALCASAILLGKTYMKCIEAIWIPWAMTFTFMPMYFALQYGQVVPLMVFGAALFAWAIRTNRHLLAGAATVLLAIKPHLAYLVWLAIALDAFTNRRWKILTGVILSGSAAAAVPLAFNNDVYSQYLTAMRDNPPAQWVTLTIGALLRYLFGEYQFWLQFMPMLLGLSWLTYHWQLYSRDWNWNAQFPWLILVSFVTTPYGAWHFDLMLLIIPLTYLASLLIKYNTTISISKAVIIYVIMNLAMIYINVTEINILWYAFVAPLVLVLCMAAARSPHPLPYPETVRA